MTTAATGGARRYRPPRDTRIYAVGDIHGRADLLSDMIDRIEDDQQRRPAGHVVEIYLGDYIDRGNDSRTVIDILCRRMVQRSAICLRGNHEVMLEDFLEDGDVLHDWTHNGGLQTLASYGVSLSHSALRMPVQAQRALMDALPRTHALFFECLKDYHQCGGYLFVHAGIRPGVPLAAQVQDDLVWIRDEFLQSTADHGYMVVHGHTPVAHPQIFSNRINIDTGAVFSGRLTCARLEDSSISFL